MDIDPGSALQIRLGGAYALRMRRLNTSTTKATYTEPIHVET